MAGRCAVDTGDRVRAVLLSGPQFVPSASNLTGPLRITPPEARPETMCSVSPGRSHQGLPLVRFRAAPDQLRCGGSRPAPGGLRLAWDRDPLRLQ